VLCAGNLESRFLLIVFLSSFSDCLSTIALGEGGNHGIQLLFVLNYWELSNVKGNPSLSPGADETMNKDKIPAAVELIQEKIAIIRGERVMLDNDLAALYCLENKQLKRAVRRNIERFPEDFMFELREVEFDDLRSQFGTSSWGGIRLIKHQGK
jgi:hypothetical protein